MNLTTVMLIIAILTYFVVVFLALSGWEKRKRLDIIITENRQSDMKLLFFEHLLLEKLHLKPENGTAVIYVERVVVATLLALSFLTLRGLTILAFGAVLIILLAEDSYRKIIYESGITNISRIVNFINYFVPHISSGNSADQSLLGYIEYSRDVELAEFYEHRFDPEYKLETHLRQIVDIYDIAKYNEEKGINDYTYILNELSKDYAQKQVYYNSFMARIGEIKPIMLSYYFGVPILIAISFGQTYSFWMGFGGYIVATLVLGLFGLFKFLIYKLQKDTVKTIF